jgi:hypothetical protein
MALTNIGSTVPASEQDAQKVATYNNALNEIDATLAGRLSKSVAGSANVTLSRDEGLNAFFIFTGALTGNIEVRWPASGGTPRKLSVHNNTTGAFSLTLTVAGGSGVAITQGERREFVIDGTAVVAMNTGTIGTYTAVAAQAIWARVYHNATQSIPNATDTTLNFNSERADTDVIHDNVTNNPRLTCKTAGVYYIVAGIGFASNTTGRREVFIRLNGATQIASAILPAASGVITRIPPIGTLYPLAVNDYVEVIVNQTSGGALNTDVGANATPEFMMIRLGGS